MTSAWQDLVRDASGTEHLVRLYREGEFPAAAIAAWIGDGLRHGSGAVIVGTPGNVDRIRVRLREDEKLDPDGLDREGRFAVLDAADTLARVMVANRPDGAAFHSVAGAAIRRARDASDRTRPVRVWGEMVDVLWHAHQVLAARRLEEYWNEIIQEEGIELFCTYGVDNLDPATHAGPLRDICATHTHLVPETDAARLDAAVTRALVDVFGKEEAEAVQRVFASPARHATVMPPAEAVLMGLHEVSPDLGARVLAATRKHWEA